jgi:hypothetical protein
MKKPKARATFFEEYERKKRETDIIAKATLAFCVVSMATIAYLTLAMG